MKILVFDIDNTLIIHGKNSNGYYKDGCVMSNFRELLESKNFERIYIYTNGTYGHGEAIVKHLGISDMISFIYARDNLRIAMEKKGPIQHGENMKPHPDSFDYVHLSIIADSGSEDNEIHFFDDMKENLKTAHDKGWITYLINPNERTETYINHSFSNIYSALISHI